jgi:hypothetical protein
MSGQAGRASFVMAGLVLAIHAVTGLEPRTRGESLAFGGELIVEGAALGQSVEIARRREMVIARDCRAPQAWPRACRLLRRRPAGAASSNGWETGVDRALPRVWPGRRRPVAPPNRDRAVGRGAVGAVARGDRAPDGLRAFPCAAPHEAAIAERLRCRPLAARAALCPTVAVAWHARSPSCEPTPAAQRGHALNAVATVPCQVS